MVFDLHRREGDKEVFVAAITCPAQDDAVNFAREILLANRDYDLIAVRERSSPKLTEWVKVSYEDYQRANEVQRIAAMLQDRGFVIAHKLFGGDNRPRVVLKDVLGGVAEVEIDADNWRPEHDQILIDSLKELLPELVKQTKQAKPEAVKRTLH